MNDKPKSRPLFDLPIVKRAMIDALWKLNPRNQIRNPVMFTVFIGSILTTGLFIHALVGQGEDSPRFIFGISAWLWFTVIFANFAEAMAEGRGKAQADNLRKARTQTFGQRLTPSGGLEQVPADKLRKDDVVVVTAGELIPGDGDIIEGAATVDESAITGES